MKKILLHICCGICALYSIEKLKELGFYVEGIFFNPNIYPEDEYRKRKDVADEVAKLHKIKLIDVEYHPKIWIEYCGKYSNEKEGGRRCLLCYELRLKKTFEFFKKKEFGLFTTTLTISPHKDSRAIINIGKEVGGNHFFSIDFKKEDGFKKTIELAKKYNFYRQNYCGCIYSIKK
jgi:ribonuclease HII